MTVTGALPRNATIILTHAVILQDPSGRSKGCGIVEFTDAVAAQEAIEAMNNTVS